MHGCWSERDDPPGDRAVRRSGRRSPDHHRAHACGNRPRRAEREDPLYPNDQNGTSTCTSGPCSRAWGALVSDPAELQIAPGITGTFGITIWGDGTQQVTHNGQPLYYYSEDRAPGDAEGEGVAGVRCIARITAGTGCGAASAPEATFLIPGPAQRAAESAEDY